jgi:hypothetical protein
MFPGDYCAGIGPAGWLFMIGFWAAVIAVIMWAVTRLFPTSQQRRDPRSVSTSGWPSVGSTPTPPRHLHRRPAGAHRSAVTDATAPDIRSRGRERSASSPADAVLSGR